MLLKTSELTGIALDWAVAKAEGYSPLYPNYPKGAMTHLSKVEEYSEYRWLVELMYSKSWSLAGPIIEREGISLRKEPSGGWYAFKNFSTCEEMPFTHCSAFDAGGETALEAAMRCYVQSKLGEEIEIPDELAGGLE